MTGRDVALTPPPTPEPAGRPVEMRVLLWLLRGPGWWILRHLGHLLWRYRDVLAPWWAAVAALAVAAAGVGLGAPWWAAGAWLIAAAVIRTAGHDRLPVDPDVLAGVCVVTGVWSASALEWGLTAPIMWAWAGLAAVVTLAWLLNPAARQWRGLRSRVRSWRGALPHVLASLGAAGVVVARRVVVRGDGRVEVPLRLSVGVTREALDTGKMRRQIESGMHWPSGAIREIVQDPAHTSSARVILVWQDGRIRTRLVRLDLRQAPDSIYTPMWCGEDADGQPVTIEQVAREGMTRGLYGGEPGSAKSNLLRLIAALRAYCPDVLIWVIDRKNNGMTFASLLPRIDWIATTREEAIMMLEAAAAGIPLRGRLLRPEHNQLLPLSAQVPGVLVLYDEFAAELGKGQKNAAAVDAARVLLAQGRATGWGAELASQYLSQTSLHPDLKPLFPRSYAGRTRTRADAQFLLRAYTRVDTTRLPTGAFYTEAPGVEQPLLVHTPEVTDADLLRAAAETAHLSPRLEAQTAEGLPHYAGRWSRMPEHLLPYASEEQRAAAAPLPSPARPRTAAASSLRLVVHERMPDGDDAAMDDAVDDVARDDVGGAATAMLDLLLERELASTGELDAAAKTNGRSRQWASVRRAEWQERGLIRQVGRGRWALQVRDEGPLWEAAGEAERSIRSRRAARGGDAQ
jgi:hypothetical protein